MMTTTEAAALLSERGYTVRRGRVGGEGPPSADTLKHWCQQGKFPGAVFERRGPGRGYWLIPRGEVLALVAKEETPEV